MAVGLECCYYRSSSLLQVEHNWMSPYRDTFTGSHAQGQYYLELEVFAQRRVDDIWASPAESDVQFSALDVRAEVCLHPACPHLCQQVCALVSRVRVRYLSLISR
jgi:hypothetical protein